MNTVNYTKLAQRDINTVHASKQSRYTKIEITSNQPKLPCYVDSHPQADRPPSFLRNRKQGKSRKTSIYSNPLCHAVSCVTSLHSSRQTVLCIKSSSCSASSILCRRGSCSLSRPFRQSIKGILLLQFCRPLFLVLFLLVTFITSYLTPP